MDIVSAVVVEFCNCSPIEDVSVVVVAVFCASGTTVDVFVSAAAVVFCNDSLIKDVFVVVVFCANWTTGNVSVVVVVVVLFCNGSIIDDVSTAIVFCTSSTFEDGPGSIFKIYS